MMWSIYFKKIVQVEIHCNFEEEFIYNYIPALPSQKYIWNTYFFLEMQSWTEEQGEI